MDKEVSVSDIARALQMPASPKYFGSRINAGMRNTAPLNNANIMEGATFSTLWKYPIAVRLKIKAIKAEENIGKPSTAMRAAGRWESRKRLTMADGAKMKAEVTAIPQTNEVIMARRSVATTRVWLPFP